MTKSLRTPWDTGLMLWIWHAMFDGTKLCHCAHSRWMKARHERI